MLIRCPKCQVCYRIEETLLAKGSRKLRCAKCEEVWEAKPEDCFEEQDVSEEEVYDLSGASANTPENESPAEDNKQEDNKQETDSLFKIRESGGQLDAEKATIPDEEPAPSEEEAKPASEEAQVSENDKEEKIDEKDLTKLIKNVLNIENINADEDSIRLVVELANGGARDALSLLDQIIAYSGNNIVSQDIEKIFGLTSATEKITLLKN